MARLSMAQAYAYARQAGFDPASAVIMSAIAMGESGLRTDAIGDTTLTNSVWGPSIGLGQIRSVKADTGTGKDRDIDQLTDPLQNMIAAYHISSNGQDFSPWTVYNTGKYRDYLGQARAAAGSSTGATGQIVQTGLGSWLTSGNSLQGIGLQLLAVTAGAALIILGGYQAGGTRRAAA